MTKDTATLMCLNMTTHSLGRRNAYRAPELPDWKTRYNRIKHLRQRLAVDCGRRIKPLSVLVCSIGARVAASDYEGLD